MTISVLMSVYEKETGEHLDRSMRSIWDDQIRKPDQIVLVEDGPLTKELYNVIDKWRSILGTKLCSPKNETNRGLAVALNRGLQSVTSDLVARMDSDDMSAPERLRLQEEYMKQHPEVDVVGGAMQEFSDENPCISVRYYPTNNIRTYICKASPVAHATTMMRMSLFREYGLKYDDRYPLNEDIALWFDVLRKGRSISNVGDIVYLCECNGGMFERRSRQKAWPEFKAWMIGIKDLYGIFTWRYIYPVSRLIFRYMPTKFIVSIYQGKIRKKFLTNK